MTTHARLRIAAPGVISLIALYCYWPVAVPFSPCVVGYESLTTACSLVHKASFSDPFWIMPTGPTAHLAPMWPVLLSLLFRVFGDGPAGLYAMHWLASLTFALQVGLWPWLAESLGMGFVSGVVAAAAWLGAGYVLNPMWEAPLVAALVPVLAVCTYRLLSRPVSTAFVALVAALWGITLLFSPVPFPVYLGLTAGVLALSQLSRAQKLVLAAIPFLVISPWVVRNYAVFHHVFLIRDNLGMELSLSNNSCATYSFDYNESHQCYDHPNKSPVEAQKVRIEGEYQYNQEKLREALGWIRKNPARFATLTRERFMAFWFLVPDWKDLTGADIPRGVLTACLVAPLSFAGLGLLFRRDRNAAWVCLAWLALFPPVYYFMQFAPRFRYPILWASFLPAAFFVTEVPRPLWRRLRKSPTPVTSALDFPPLEAHSALPEEKSSADSPLILR